VFDSFFPVLLSLLSAFLFALGAQFQSLGLVHMDSRSGAAITISTSAMLYLLVSPFFLNLEYLLEPAILIFVLVGLFRPAVSANLALAGLKFLGPTLSSTLTSTAPLFAVGLGIIFLDEVLNFSIGIGTLVIVLAIMMLAKKDGKISSGWPLWALALPIGAAAIRALAHVLTKVGMEEIPDAYLAGLIGFVVSAIVTLIIHKSRRVSSTISLKNPGTKWFIGASACFSLAVLSLNTALYNGQVIQVIPIVAASPIFTLLLSIGIFRQEVITKRIVLAVFMVVPAVMLIATA
jgi:DME family drug/metabolite transporter|tara:strand:- start:1150 stop:2022 length:873 start_codon:yes stop_codon:yes gene_type:complete